MRVLFFAQARDAAGVSELEMKISGSIGADEFWAQICGLYPKLAVLRKTTRLAHNGEYAGGSVKFNDADEVALIPPVSGG